MGSSVTSVPDTHQASIHDAIAKRAREIWQERGCVDGHAEEDWAQAESEIRSRAVSARPETRRIVVRAGETFYTGEYDASTVNSYHRGELGRGDQIKLHFEGDKMWIKLSNGRELETKVVRKEVRL